MYIYVCIYIYNFFFHFKTSLFIEQIDGCQRHEVGNGGNKWIVLFFSGSSKFYFLKKTGLYGTHHECKTHICYSLCHLARGMWQELLKSLNILVRQWVISTICRSTLIIIQSSFSWWWSISSICPLVWGPWVWGAGCLIEVSFVLFNLILATTQWGTVSILKWRN